MSDTAAGTPEKHGLRYIETPQPASAGIPINDPRRWPGGTVPVVIPDECSSLVVAGIHFFTNLGEREAPLPIHFIFRTTEKDFVRFVPNSPQNSSLVGRLGGEQLITLKADATPGNVAHEIMHTLGFFHEHQHVDRGGHLVAIDAPNHDPNFGIRGVDYTDYDFDSIMHYQLGEYRSVDGNPVMLAALWQQPAHQGFIGQRTHLSTLDKDGIRFLYGQH